MADQSETGNESVDTADVASASDSVETADSAGQSGDDTSEGNTSLKTDNDETESRSDKRIRELIEEGKRKDSQISQILANQQQTQQQAQSEDIRLLSDHTNDELRDMQEDDPLAYTQLVQMDTEQKIYARLRQEAQQNQQNQAWNKFSTDNSDFQAKVNDGSIQQLMQSDPTHNARSAYESLVTKERTEAAIAKAVKAKEDEMNKNFAAKKRITPLRGGGGGIEVTDNVDDNALKDTKKSHGSLIATLTARSNARAAGG